MNAAPTDAASAVRAAIHAILSRWTALHLAVTHSDAQSPSGIAESLLADFVMLALSTSPRARPADYELLCADTFEALGADVEDGSVAEVVAAVVRVRDAAEGGDLAAARAEVEKGTGGQGVLESFGEVREVEEGEEGSEEEGESAMEVEEVGAVEPEVDADGFTTVTKRQMRQTRSMTRGNV